MYNQKQVGIKTFPESFFFMLTSKNFFKFSKKISLEDWLSRQQFGTINMYMLSGCDHAVKTPERQKMQEPDERENRKERFCAGRDGRRL